MTKPFAETALSAASLRLKGVQWPGGDWKNHPSLNIGYRDNRVSINIWANHPSKDINRYLSLTPVQFSILLSMIKRVGSDPDHTGFRNNHYYRAMSNGMMSLNDQCISRIYYNSDKLLELSLQFPDMNEEFKFPFTPDPLMQPCTTNGDPITPTVVSGMLAGRWAELIEDVLGVTMVARHTPEKDLAAARKLRQIARLEASASATAVSNFNNSNSTGFDSGSGLT